MVRNDISVVICCAGMGTRLGIGSTKALVKINQKPLILYLLEQLDEVEDVRVVVGYQAKQVIDVVRSYRKDVMFVCNYNFATTGPAASLSKALVGAKKYTLYLDGDLLIDPSSFQKALSTPGSWMGVSSINSDEPFCIEVNDKQVTSFIDQKDGATYEWPGMACVKTDQLEKSLHHVYDMLEPLLPLDRLDVNTREIDTMDDYDRANAWVLKGYQNETRS